MVCYYPIEGYLCKDGCWAASRKTPFSKKKCRDCESMSVPCSTCFGCRRSRTLQWAIRITHESKLYSQNCFLTLTYDKSRLPFRDFGAIPADVGLHYPDFQLFMKSLRERFNGCDSVSHPFFGQIDKKHNKPYPEFYNPIRFYMCGEYGEERGRPHFHVMLFNFNFPDRKFWRRTKSGQPIFRSAILEELWPYGNSEIGSVSFDSAAYVAGYVQKKVFGDKASDAYRWVDPDTGEIFMREPEFSGMSLKPGIAYGWLKQFYGDVYPDDFVVFKGLKFKPPKYYDKKYFDLTAKAHIEFEVGLDGFPYDFKQVFLSADMEAIKFERFLKAQEYLDNSSPERLMVREQVDKAQFAKSKRTLT